MLDGFVVHLCVSACVCLYTCVCLCLCVLACVCVYVCLFDLCASAESDSVIVVVSVIVSIVDRQSRRQAVVHLPTRLLQLATLPALENFYLKVNITHCL